MASRPKLKTTLQRSRLMSRVRQSGTSAELTVRRLLRSLGFRYRVKARDLPGSPDIANRDSKWAIFVHGCFWHAHQGCSRWKIPQNNRSFWKTKFSQNRERDRRRLQELQSLGYSVLTVWECELEEEEKLRKKLIIFLRNVKEEGLNIKSIGMRSCSNGDSNPINSERETYEFSTRKRCVTRRVRLTSGKTCKTNLTVGITIKPNDDPHSVFDWTFLRMLKEPTFEKAIASTIRVADLFSGCGGLSLGTREACKASGRKFSALLAIDNEPFSLNTYKQNFNPKYTFKSDIRDVIDGAPGARRTNKEKALLKKLKKINILLAGPPCQGHSDLNNHTRRTDYRNGLYERVSRFAFLLGPEHILVENVPTVIHSHDKILDETINRLQRIGYEVSTGIVDLSEIGVPQRRKRHVLVASCKKVTSVEEVVHKNRVASKRSVKWAIEDLRKESPNGAFTTGAELSHENSKRINYLFKNNQYDLPNRLRPPCHRDEVHSYKSMYGRLKFNEPAQTITSGFGSPGQGRYIHPTQKRTLTPHEAARLQFFPDFFDFSGVTKRTALANMIGNAVPMKLSYIFCLEFLT